MTTIAYDGKTIASDTQVSGNFKLIIPSKIGKSEDGRLFGSSGNASLCCKFMEWLKDKKSLPYSAISVGLTEENFPDIIEIETDGTIFLYACHGRFPVSSHFCAIGSGSKYAITAMHLGKTAVEAVAIASQFDEYTNDIIVSLERG